AYFSSTGPTLYDGRIKPDILAPGVNITAASHYGSGYVSMSGTSMATPFAAGVMALAAQAKPGINPNELKDAAKGTAVPLPQQNITQNQQGKGVIDPITLIHNIAPEINIEA
ncbi:MAG: S8 family serine peptidase, partial [bacterium]|nr:S8 family serine peptidase [bacterium]